MKVLKDMNIEANSFIRTQFDLAQMTVLDEHLAGDEYSDMEFEEFLEFLVRIAYVIPGDNVQSKLTQLLC